MEREAMFSTNKWRLAAVAQLVGEFTYQGTLTKGEGSIQLTSSLRKLVL
jgi:hypothetical protein